MTGPGDARIAHLGVVVPAHNEQDLLPACIDALNAAAARVDVTVDLLIVLDACTDLSYAAAGSTATLVVDARNVGAARRAGFARVLERRPPAVSDRLTWLATTDADSLVPGDWLQRMLIHAAAGWDAVAGTVQVTDWTEHDDLTRATWYDRYDHGDDHRHVHGANLGVRADAYNSVGGMAPIRLSEDAHLVDALESAGRSVCRAGDLSVITSARRGARAAGGFASYLTGLGQAADGFQPAL